MSKFTVELSYVVKHTRKITVDAGDEAQAIEMAKSRLSDNASEVAVTNVRDEAAEREALLKDLDSALTQGGANQVGANREVFETVTVRQTPFVSQMRPGRNGDVSLRAYREDPRVRNVGAEVLHMTSEYMLRKAA